MVLFSTDGASLDWLVAGVVPGVLPTVDFGSGSQSPGLGCEVSSTHRCGGDSKAAFAAQRLMEAGCPLVNSEYYPGWLDHWCDFHQADS